MLRGLRLLFGLTALVTASAGVAHSQYYGGYGGYGGGGGWGGSTGTIEGSYLRGLGMYAEGAGIYNKQTAEANAINADSAMRYNQYLYEANKEGRRRYGAYLARKNGTANADYDKKLARMKSNPNRDDIGSGDALNVILDEMTDPKVANGSSLRLAAAPVSAAAIRDIPFQDDTDAITISLDQLTENDKWPAVLQGDEFKPEREAYQKAVDDALAEDKEDGILKPETIKHVRDTVSKLYAKADKTYPNHSRPEHLQAINYLKGLSGLSRALERPNLAKVISELEKVENTTVGNLVAFMASYSLRFGVAQTPKQRAIYEELYPVMVAQRDKLIGRPEAAPPAGGAVAKDVPVGDPTSIFHGFDPKHLHPSTGDVPPSPPVPVPAPAVPPTPAPPATPNP